MLLALQATSLFTATDAGASAFSSTDGHNQSPLTSPDQQCIDSVLVETYLPTRHTNPHNRRTTTHTPPSSNSTYPTMPESPISLDFTTPPQLEPLLTDYVKERIAHTHTRMLLHTERNLTQKLYADVLQISAQILANLKKTTRSTTTQTSTSDTES